MLGSPPLRGITAYYGSPVERFLSSDPATVLGLLVAADGGSAIDATQRQAWQEEIEILRRALPGLSGTVYLEFAVPRLGSRIDAVLVTGPALFPIEFKCGEKRFTQPNFRQSESEFLISYLDRHESWAVIVCLVGGGQEIHTGEAGIAEWLGALAVARNRSSDPSQEAVV